MLHEQSIGTALSRDGAPVTPTPAAHASERLAALGSVGGLLLVAGLAFAMRFERFRPTVFLVFLFMVGVGPPLSAGLVYLSEHGRARLPFRSAAFVVAVKSLLLCLVATSVALALVAAVIRPQEPPPTAPILFFLASGITVIGWRALGTNPLRDYSTRLDALLVLALGAAVLVFSPFAVTEPVPFGLVRYALNAAHFGIWAAVGIVWAAAGIRLRRREGWAFPHRKRLLESIALVATGLVILSLYDDGHFVDMAHYMPLVGAALHAMRGGIPMVDTYSQYGLLPWLVVRAAFAMFAPTFGTAAVVVRLVNLAYFTVLMLTLFFVSRRRLSALWFFVPALLAAITSHNPGPVGMWNMNALPMTLGGRYLLPAVMTLVLTAAPQRRWARWTAIALMALASLASVEIFVFTLAPWGYCRLLDSARSRSLSHILRETAIACAAVAAAQACLVALIYLSTGAIADYRPYFSLFIQFRPDESSSGWSMPFDADYALWLPIGLAYFLIMAAAFYRALRRDAPDSIVERLVPVAVMGLGPLAYFFGRPQEGTLSISFIPFAVVAIGIAEPVFINARRFGPAGPALSAVMALSFAFTIADGFEHFMRPLDPGRGNATILRRCFTEEGCRLADVPSKINLALHAQPLDPRTEIGAAVAGIAPRIEEAISMLRRLAPGERYVGMLTDVLPCCFPDAGPAIGATAFMATGQWYAWSVSSPLNDQNSAIIYDRILRRVAATPSGMLIILPNEPDGRINLNIDIVDRLVRRCRLAPVEKGRYFSAFRTEDCAG